MIRPRFVRSLASVVELEGVNTTVAETSLTGKQKEFRNSPKIYIHALGYDLVANLGFLFKKSFSTLDWIRQREELPLIHKK